MYAYLDEGSKVPLIMAYHHGYGGGGPVTITPKLPVTDNLKDVLTYEVTVKWQNPLLPCPYDTPEGIFSQCYIPLP